MPIWWLTWHTSVAWLLQAWFLVHLNTVILSPQPLTKPFVEHVLEWSSTEKVRKCEIPWISGWIFGGGQIAGIRGVKQLSLCLLWVPGQGNWNPRFPWTQIHFWAPVLLNAPVCYLYKEESWTDVLDLLPFSGVRRVNNKGEKVMYDLEKRINEAVFPGLQGGPHNNAIAGESSIIDHFLY